MMINSDTPIQTKEMDQLHRHGFVDQLAFALFHFNAEESVTIGLYGKWGSGKTSVINLLEKALLEKNTMCEEAEKKLYLMRFNPWLFSNQNQLLYQFFEQLTAFLKRSEAKSKLQELGAAIEKYSQIFDCASNLPALSIAGKVLAETGRLVGQTLQEHVMAEREDVVALKESIGRALTTQEDKLVIVIDDIDRLTNQEILQVFQLVKAIADFPNTIYVLPFDREVVVEALNNTQNGRGREYLEKVVQLPFALPEPRRSDLDRLFFEKLEETLGTHQGAAFDRQRWTTVYMSAVSSFFTSIRDIVRFHNVFSMKYVLLQKEIDWMDLLCITVLQIFEPTLCRRLIDYRQELCGSYTIYSPYHWKPEEHKTRCKEVVEELLKPFGELRRMQLINLLGCLFPMVGDLYQVFGGEPYDFQKFKRERRMAYAEYFLLYFQFVLDDSLVSKATAEFLIDQANLEDTKSMLIQLSEKGQAADCLECMKVFFEGQRGKNSHRERISLLLEALHQIWFLLEAENRTESMFGLPFSWRMDYLLEALLRVFSEEEDRYALLQELFTKDEVDLERMLESLFYLEGGLGRFTDQEPRRDPLLGLSWVESLEQLALGQLRHFGEREENDADLTALFWYWYCLDESGLRKRIEQMCQTERGYALAVSGFVEQGWMNGSVRFWHVRWDELQQFFDPHAAYEKLALFLTTGEFLMLPIDKRNQLLAFAAAVVHPNEVFEGQIYQSSLDQITKSIENGGIRSVEA